MGKSTGADAAKGKMTYPAVMGLTQARQTGESLVEEAAQIARELGPKAEPLEALALYIMERTH
jgi:geranylgeranyl diphosphate synthase type II